MELGLSLGEAPKPFSFMDKASSSSSSSRSSNRFCMALGVGPATAATTAAAARDDDDDDDRETEHRSASVSAAATEEDRDERPPVQLDLLPLVPVPRHPPLLTFPWPADHGNSEAGSSSHIANTRGFDVNRLPSADDHEDAAAATVDSPNSAVSSFQMDFSIYRSGIKRDAEAVATEAEAERASSRASDEEENGMTRKKLRLSKEQSAFLEESFKEHNTLNPKQKLALAKQLNLRPRQVEVWFQNRRARTKLKQTEVDCEYLKRCCETLTEENRRLQKELQELRALKTSHPFYMQLPATTLTMCPSCERVAATNTTSAAAAAASASAATDAPSAKPAGFQGLAKPRFYPFSQAHQPPSAAS